jgi:opacity protein-like surface antigen
MGFLLLAPCSLLFAQQVEIGGSLGGSSYLGDLNQYNPVKISGLSGSLFLKNNFTPHWGVGFHLSVGSIKGNDASSKNEQFQDRNLSFKTSLQEVSAIGEFNLFNLYAYNRKGKITPYLFAGIGALIFNPTTEYQGDKYELRAYNTEGQSESYKKYTITFPYGAGVKYKIKDNWTIFSQVGYRAALTDFIDDVSGVYAPATSWAGSSASISAALADRSGDTYMFVGIGISYTFVSQNCFTF